MNKRQLLKHFGLNEMGIYREDVFQKNKQALRDAIINHDMVGVVGDAGMGKSVLFRETARELMLDSKHQVEFVFVNDWFRDRLTIANIINAIIMDLSKEGPRRCMEARTRQVTRILGQKAVIEKKKVCVVLEQGHRMHLNTIIALKELREAVFAGRDKLCSVLLLGHPLMKSKIASRDEIYLRTDFIDLDHNHGWMKYEERVKFLECAFGNALDETARARIATRKKTPLEMEHYVFQKMAEQAKLGLNVIDGDAVEATIQEIREDGRFSYRQIARVANLGKTSVENAFNGSAPHLVPRVKEAMLKLEEKNRQQEIEKTIQGV